MVSVWVLVCFRFSLWYGFFVATLGGVAHSFGLPPATYLPRFRVVYCPSGLGPDTERIRSGYGADTERVATFKGVKIVSSPLGGEDCIFAMI